MAECRQGVFRPGIVESIYLKHMAPNDKKPKAVMKANKMFNAIYEYEMTTQSWEMV
jgi:hypothetical protein